MARSRSRSQGSRKQGSRAQAGGSSSRGKTSARSRKSAAPADVEVVEESAGMGIDDGIIIMTTVVLAAAVLAIDYVRGAFYDTGMFF